MNLFIFFHISLSIFIIPILYLNFSNAHNDCFFILGNSDNNVYKESLARKILQNQLPELQEKATFRMLTKDSEKWKSLLTDEDQILMKIQHYEIPLTLIIVYEGTNEMSLKEISLLSQLIQYAKQFALSEIGKETAVQTKTILLNSAHCTHKGRLQIDSPNKVYFCNDIEADKIPLLQPGSITEDFEVSPHSEKKNKNVTHIMHVSHRRDMRYIIEEDTRAGVKHKRRRPTKQKIEELKFLAKRSRRKHHSPEKIMELPIAQRKLMCKYRKSCYETGIIPTELHTSSIKIEPKPIEDVEEHEISEAEIKLVCKYRKSCYAEIGKEEGKKPKIKKHRVLTGKARVIVDRQKTKKSLKEIANKALEQVKKQESKRDLLPKPKKVIVERKVNESEIKKLHLSCKYRKSCYTTGKPPTLASKYEFLTKFIMILPNVHRQEKQKNFTELDEFEKKLFCHYRQSCYNSGTKPTRKNATELKIKHVIKKEEKEIPLQIRCKYRKSCYETKVPPTIKPLENKVAEKAKPPLVIETLTQLKLHCRYRKSCYQRKLNEHEREEFLKDMQKGYQIIENTDKIEIFEEAEQEMRNLVAKTKRENLKEGKKCFQETKARIKEEKEVPKKYSTSTETETSRVLQEKKEKQIQSAQNINKTKNLDLRKTKNVKANGTMALNKKKQKKHDGPHRTERQEIRKKKSETMVTDKRNESVSLDLSKTKEEPVDAQKKLKKLIGGKKEKTLVNDIAKSSMDKLFCKYRKSCYGKGKRYMINISEYDQPKGRKRAELRCKYRKSCYETGKKSEIKQKLFTPMEELVKRIYTEVENGKQPTGNNKKLYCKYRKSCYNTGKIPSLDESEFKNLAETKADATQTQIRCKYRKSCYQKSNILLDRKIEKLKRDAKREEVVSDPTTVKENLQIKTAEEKRKGGNEKRVKKDNEQKNGEEEDDGDKNEKKDKAEQKVEAQYKQIKVNEPKLEEKRLITTREKLSCKYRKRCYEGHETIKFKLQKLESVSLKDLKRPNGQPCNIYYISCRKLAGLPLRQRAPIGPSGKRLCRKKPKNTNAT